MRNSPLYKSAADFASQVRATLKQAGVSATAAADFNFYLYLDTRAKAHACVQQLRANGFTAKVERSAISTGQQWLCFASGHLVPSGARLTQIGSIFLKLGDKHDGVFDGWEIQPKPMDIPDGLLKSLMEQFSKAKKKRKK